MPTIPETLTLAVAHHRAGRLPQAEHIYRQILQRNGQHPDALHLLGVIAHQTGQHRLAVDRIRRAIQSNPDAAVFHSNLGAAYEALGEIHEAVGSYQRALQLNPDFAEAHYKLGNALKDQGKLDPALAAYQRALRLNPNHPQAHNNSGTVRQRRGDLEGAVAAYRRALQLKPDYAEAHNNLGCALRALGELHEAEASFRRALQLRPDYADAHNNLGVTLKNQERPEEAGACYERALQIDPQHADALANLAGWYESHERIQEAASTAARALQVGARHPLANLVAAKCEAHRNRRPEAIERLLRLRPFVADSMENAREIAFQLGQLYDREGDTVRAFEEFVRANRLAMQEARQQHVDKRRYLERVDRLREVFTRAWVDGWGPAPPPGPEGTPVFLIGFPRSGTTLLDVILDSHPKIQTLEEKPTVPAMQQQVAGLPGGYPRALGELRPAQIEQLRATYFRTAEAFVDRLPGRILLDKHPLNSVDVGLILRVFPAARLIVALRHPCDVCLSCFMQSFHLTDVMVNFCTLQDTAVLYDKVMRLQRQYARVLPHSQHVVKYEELVDDFEAATRRLLRFLDLDWDDGLRGYAEHARQNRKVAMPNYQQVTRPIYGRARNRWHRYAEQLAPVMDLLEPHMEYFGYGADGPGAGGGG